MNEVKNRLIAEFAEKEYAHAYMASHTVSKISAQIYWTRKMRKWTQTKLAAKAGMKQERISKIEAGDFSSLTMNTLQKLAEALDINLRVEFEPFSHGIVSVCNQSIGDLELPSRTESLAQLLHSVAEIQGLYGQPPVFVPGVIAKGSAITGGPAGTSATTGSTTNQWLNAPAVQA